MDLAIENGGSFHSYVNVYQRVTNKYGVIQQGFHHVDIIHLAIWVCLEMGYTVRKNTHRLMLF